MSDDDLIEASPCKLRNGNWGCKTPSPVAVGDTVRIVTRANKQWKAQITQIVWTDDTVCICETESQDNKRAGGSAKPDTDAASAKSRPRSSRPRTAPTPGGDPDYDDAGRAGTGQALPPADPGPSDELDAMADRAAESDDAFDELMNAADERDREG